MKRPFSILLAFLTLSFAFGQDSTLTDKIVSSKKENGWYRIVTSSGISIALPPGWKIKLVTGKGLSQILDAAASLTARMKYTPQEKAAIQQDSGVRFMALAPRDSKTQFAPNVNVIRDGDVPSGGLAATVQEAEDGLKKVGAVIKAVTDVSLASGQAKRISYSIDTTKYTLLGFAYATIRGKWAYLVTFTVPSSVYPGIKGEIERMAKSFNVVSLL
jgi:hypothetical protein